MNRLVLFMARRRITWVLWMSLGTLLLILPLKILECLVDCAVQSIKTIRFGWRWRWNADFADLFALFGEQHRKSLRSLASRPESGGKLMRR
jgi:hypothetical protein